MRHTLLFTLPVLGLFVLSGCEVQLDTHRDIDPGLQRRIDNKTLEANNGKPETLLELGELYAEAGWYFEAADAFKRAKDAGGSGSRLLAGFATSYYELGYFQPAVENLKACHKINRLEPGCILVFARLMMSLNDPKALQDARGAYMTFVRVAPNHPKADFARAELDQLNEQLGPLTLPETPPASQPASQPAQPALPASQPAAATSDPGVSTDIAIPGHGNVDPESGEPVGELNPFGVAIMKAINASKRGDIATAETAYNDALKILPNDPSALAGLAEVYMAQNRQPEAVQTIEKAYAAHPEDRQVKYVFGEIMLRARKRTDEAVKAWRSLEKQDPELAKQLRISERLKGVEQLLGK